MVKNRPKDEKMYNRIKASVYKANPKHSAYRSGQIVKQYKAAFKKKYGSKSPYTGNKAKGSLTRWYREEWRTEKGKKTYKAGGVIFRPTKRISKKTPATMSELTKKQKAAAIKEKAKTGKVKKFKK
mgnify:CR=1 FL=1|tara:strand:+ start:251 stop:628 length:378 start_codon:yes stop_codon:yes gene_type:complete